MARSGPERRSRAQESIRSSPLELVDTDAGTVDQRETAGNCGWNPTALPDRPLADVAPPSIEATTTLRGSKPYAFRQPKHRLDSSLRLVGVGLGLSSYIARAASFPREPNGGRAFRVEGSELADHDQ